MRLRAAVLAGAIMACGKPSEPTPPPPPPPPPTPASLAVAAGADQQGEPGLALPVRPAVAVRSSSGAPVPGVNVSFAVDSGGGSIEGGTVTTGADGIATAGAWSLGPATGRNTLLVTAGSLPAIRIGALGRFPQVAVLSDVTVPVGGGTFRASQPAGLAKGIELAVPAGTFSQATRWTIAASKSVALPVPDDVELASPVVSVTNGQGQSDSTMTLTIPISAAPDEPVGAFYYDSTSRWLEPVSLAARTDTNVTVVAHHFSAAELVAPATAAGFRAQPAAPVPFGSVVIVVLKVKSGLLASKVGAAFAPGTDDWEFANRGSYITPIGNCAGMDVTALYYAYRHRASEGPLFERYGDVVGFDEDNPTGIRFVSDVQSLWNDRSRVFTAWFDAIDKVAAGSGRPRDVVNYHSLVVSLRATGRAQLLLAFPSRTNRIGHALIAFESDHGTIAIADPNSPGQAATIRFAGDRFEPFPFRVRADRPPETYAFIALAGISSVLKLESLDRYWAQFKVGSSGIRDFPLTTLQFWDPPTDSWRTVTTDTATVRSEELVARVMCVACGNSRGATPPTDRQLTKVFDDHGTLLARDGSNNVPGAKTTVAPGPTKLGFARLSSPPGAGDGVFFIDFGWVKVRSIHTRIEPKDATVKLDEPTRFVARHDATHPPGGRYRWTFTVDGVSDVQEVVGDSTVKYTFTKGGDYTVQVEAGDAEGHRLGKAETTATTGEGPALAWRIDAITDRTGTGAPPFDFDRPTDLVLFVYRTPASPSLGTNNPTPGALLQQAAAGQGAQLVAFTPGLATLLAAHTVNGLGVEGAFTWTGPPGDGSLSGKASPLNETCSHRVTTIQATTKGATMTGTMTFHWAETGGPKTVLGDYQWKFTATRIR